MSDDIVDLATREFDEVYRISFRTQIVTAPIAWILVLLLSACGGGSGDGSGGTGSVGDDDAPGGDVETAGFALLPTDGQPNTSAPVFAQAAAGSVHAAFADLDGNVFYARCDGGCSGTEGWQTTMIAEQALEFGGYVVTRLVLTSAGQPRVAFHTTPDSFARGTTSYAACDGDCLQASAWTSDMVYSHGDALLRRSLESEDWFALNERDQPRLAFLDNGGLFDIDTRLVVAGCDVGCTAGESWRARLLYYSNLTSRAPVSIAIDGAGRTQFSYSDRGIGSDNSTLSWAACNGDCLDPETGVTGPVALQERVIDLFSLHDASLAIDDAGQPAVASFVDNGRGELSLLRCSSGCENAGNWSSIALRDRLDADELARFGRGVDIAFDGDDVVLGFVGKRLDRPLAEEVLRARCDAACQFSGGRASIETVTRTDVPLDDQPACLYLGTEAQGPVSLTGAGVGFTASPQWACSGIPQIIIDADGGRTYDSGGDIRFLELPAFAGR